MTDPKLTPAQLQQLAQAPVVLTPTGGAPASGQPTTTVAYGEAPAPATTAAYTPGAAGEQSHVLADAALLATAPTVPVTTPLAPATSTVFPVVYGSGDHQAVYVDAPPASVAQTPPTPYPPQTWAQPRTMVKWVGLGLLLGVLAALPKAPPPRKRTAICRHCGSAHMPGGLGAAPAWSA
jgi:hypothetical protein